MKKQLRIQGMYCPNCEKRIETALMKLDRVRSVHADYSAGTVDLECDGSPELSEIGSVVESLGYTLADTRSNITRIVSLWIILLGLAIIFERLGLLNRLVPRQLGENGMSYGLFFLTGLLTSVHCAAMCGGIGISQSLPGKGRWSGLLYNTGRVISYTVIGAVLGLVGMLAGGGQAASPLLQGIVKLAAGALMLLAGVNLLGLIPALRKVRLTLPGLPRLGRRPLVIGLLNGLMPCGPLQAMQLAALGSGDPLHGGLSMLFFSLGTVPLMLGLGGIVAVLGRRFTRAVNLVGAVLVAVFGIAMLSQGAALSGMFSVRQLWIILLGLAALGLVSLISDERLRAVFSVTAVASAVVAVVLTAGSLPSKQPATTVRIENGVQIVTSTLKPGHYPDITVQAGVPVRWTIYADEEMINGCNNKMMIQPLGLELSFVPGENVLEFTPTQAGTIPYSCWMGMIRGSITVTE